MRNVITTFRVAQDMGVHFNKIYGLLRTPTIAPLRVGRRTLWSRDDMPRLASILGLDYESIKDRFRDYPSRTMLEGDQGRFSVSVEELADLLVDTGTAP